MTDQNKDISTEINEQLDGTTERVERFEVLHPGTYWRAKVDVKSKWSGHDIETGLVMLLKQVRYYENKAHTLIMHNHPLRPEHEYRFLVEEFFETFEHAPDGEQVREREIAKLQAEVAEMQKDLNEAQMNPALLEDFVGKGIEEWREEEAQKARRESEAKGEAQLPATSADVAGMFMEDGVVRTDLGFAMGRGVTVSDVEKMQEVGKVEAKKAELTAKFFENKAVAIANKVRMMTPFFVEKSQVALAKTSEIREDIDEMLKGIASLDLYTGKGVIVEKIAEGKSASPDEKLTLMQRKLMVDEELAVYAPVSMSFDYSNLPEFADELEKSTELRDILLPFPRCVVSMATRRSDLDYGDALANRLYNAENRKVFLLVRDGGNIYLVRSATASHEHTSRLFPTHNEVEDLFKGVDGSTITYKDIAFTDSAKANADKALHYKRFLILLCGLDHREKLFGEFYDEHDTFNFISMDFQEKYFRFVADDEPSTLLGESRPSALEWLKSINQGVQPGSRILALHSELDTQEYVPSNWSNSVHWDPKKIAHLVRGADVYVVKSQNGKMIIKVSSEREGWDVKQTHFNATVDLSAVVRAGDWESFICIDNIFVEDIEYYIHNRESRVRSIRYIRLFKEIAELLRKEDEAQAESIQYLIDTVVQHGIVTEDEANRTVREAVNRYRIKLKGKLLPSVDRKNELNKVLELIQGVGGHSDIILERAKAFVADNNLVPLKITVKGSNTVRIYVDAPEADLIEGFMPGAYRWATCITLKNMKTKLSETGRKLVWLREADEADEARLAEFDGLEGMVHTAEAFATQRVIDNAVKRVTENLAHIRFHWLGNPDMRKENTSLLAIESFENALSKSKMIPQQHVFIPVGFEMFENNPAKIEYIGFYVSYRDLLVRIDELNGNSNIADNYIKWHADKEHAHEVIERAKRERKMQFSFASELGDELGVLSDGHASTFCLEGFFREANKQSITLTADQLFEAHLEQKKTRYHYKGITYMLPEIYSDGAFNPEFMKTLADSMKEVAK
ncbi:hypothetical protein [Neptuniibacter sp. QD37_11]|uniref:hypothetical protein n=1 Tax=Neptuniibacter sp. QD37_11 TaxID=3398209 RepID=UPI0039F54AB9